MIDCVICHKFFDSNAEYNKHLTKSLHWKNQAKYETIFKRAADTPTYDFWAKIRDQANTIRDEKNKNK